MNFLRLSLLLQALCAIPCEAELPVVPFEDRDGQRFWFEKGVSKHIHREAARLRGEGALVPLSEITTQLEKHAATDAVKIPPSGNPQAPSSPDLVRTISNASVVVMTVDQNDKDAYGTGFVIAPGIVVTNWHVAFPDKGFSDIVVMDRNGTVFPVTEGLAGAAEADLAILRFKDPSGSVPALPLAETLPPPGAAVWQVGHTHESWWTATDGIINRYCMEPFTPKGDKEEIQLPVMDVSNKVSAGSSGSAVVDDCGRVVGIYHHRRWYYQTAGTWNISEENPDNDSKAAHPAQIKDRVVLHTRNFCIPVTRLRQMLRK